MQEKKHDFPTQYESILARIRSIDPIAYGRTRNNINGKVTKISPYLTHGVISLPQVRDIVLQKYSKKESYTFIFELAWREFFQRVFVEEGVEIFNDVKTQQQGVRNFGVPKAVLACSTGIQAIDSAYKELYTTGYMHNHARMWSAMLVSNVGHYEWWDPSRHMFYYLLDGDIASNTLSWQWVAGTFSSKQYVANQEMINKFSPLKQNGSYLDLETSSLLTQDIPELNEGLPFTLTTDFSLLKSTTTFSDILEDDISLYSIWTLDPIWSPTEVPTKKVLFIEKDQLTDFPISSDRVTFILELAKNISDLHIVVGSLDELTRFAVTNKNKIFRKNHPALYNWPGSVSEPEYLFPEIVKVPRGFMAFWKKCEMYL